MLTLADGRASFRQQAPLQRTHSLDEEQLALGGIWFDGLACTGVIERNLVVSLLRQCVEIFPRPLAGNDRHAAAEGIHFNSSVFFQLALLSAGRTLMPSAKVSNERGAKNWRETGERLAEPAKSEL